VRSVTTGIPPVVALGSLAGTGLHADAGSVERAAMIAPIAIGTLTRNEARQPISSPNTAMSPPPRIGPIATETPTMPPKAPKARPRSSPWKNC
jgi:hypothetical protein